MRKVIIILFISLPFTLLAQQLKYFVGLTNGEIVYGNQIRYKSPVFGKSHIMIDETTRYELIQVAYYQNEEGYYKKFNPDGYTGATFFRREIAGDRIEVYSKTTTYTSFSPGFGGVGLAMIPMTNRSTMDYYIKDNSLPMKMTFGNLNDDLIDNPNSLMALQKVRRLRTITGILYAAGAGLVLTGFSEMSHRQAADPNRRASISPYFIAGVVSLTVPVFLHAYKRDKLIEAVELYNKQK